MDTKKISGNSIMTDGVVSFLAGLALLFLTGMSQNTTVLVLAAFAIVLGITQMVAARGETETGRGSAYLAFLGFYSLAAGVTMMFLLDATLSTVFLLVGGYVAIAGIAEAILALIYRSEISGYAWLVTVGVIRAGFGLFILLNTGLALSTFILSLAIYAMIEGVAMNVFGYEVRESIGRYNKQLF